VWEPPGQPKTSIAPKPNTRLAGIGRRSPALSGRSPRRAAPVGRRPGRGCFALYALRRTPMVHPQGCRKRCRAPRARSEAEGGSIELLGARGPMRAGSLRGSHSRLVSVRRGPGRLLGETRNIVGPTSRSVPHGSYSKPVARQGTTDPRARGFGRRCALCHA